jgi:hypothetical protein
MARIANPNSSAEKAANAIDRQRERERKFMLQNCYKHADELSTKLVQRLLDNHILETTSDSTLRELFSKQLAKLSDLEEFEIQFKIAPLRSIVNDPNFISLYLTQYIIEDLIEHPLVQDVFGDDLDIYRAVDSVMGKLRPSS